MHTGSYPILSGYANPSFNLSLEPRSPDLVFVLGWKSVTIPNYSPLHFVILFICHHFWIYTESLSSDLPKIWWSYAMELILQIAPLFNSISLHFWKPQLHNHILISSNLMNPVWTLLMSLLLSVNEAPLIPPSLLVVIESLCLSAFLCKHSHIPEDRSRSCRHY